MSVAVVQRRVEIVFVHMPAISNRDRRTGIGLVIMRVTVFEHDISLRVMDVPAVLGGERGICDIEALVNMAVGDPGVGDRTVCMMGDQTAYRIVF